MVDYPDNDFTRMIGAVSSGNRSGVRSMGVASATPLPTARSAELGQEVTEPPLTLEERAHYDQLAREAGIQDERLDKASPGGTYDSLEDAMNAGASVHPDPVVTHVSGGFVAGPSSDPRKSGRVSSSTSRLPNFKNVEGIDLLRDVVMVDGMEFPISLAEARKFRQFVVETARETILARLHEAMERFATPESAEGTDGGTVETSEVQRESAGSGEEPTF